MDTTAVETQGRTARGPSRRGPGVSVATETERPRQEPGQCPRPVSLETGHSPRRPLTSAWCPGCAGRQSRDRGRAGLRGRGLGRGVSNGVGVGEGVPGRSKHRESLPPLSLSHDRWNEPLIFRARRLLAESATSCRVPGHGSALASGPSLECRKAAFEFSILAGRLSCASLRSRL